MHAQSYLRSVPRDETPAQDALDEVVLVFGANGRIVAAAGALEPIFGASRRDIVGCDLKDLAGLAARVAPGRRRAPARPAPANDNHARPALRRVA
jgi:PAS domain-containing protein